MTRNYLELSATQGDDLTFTLKFVDGNNAPKPMADYAFACDFFKNFIDGDPACSASVDVTDAVNGNIKFNVAGADLSGIAIDGRFLKPGHRVPVVMLYGDVRIEPPPGVDLEVQAETRPKVFLTIEKRLTQ